MVHFQVRQQNQSKEDDQQSHLIGKCLASCVLSYRRCQPSRQLIYWLSIGRVSVDISVDISTKYRRIIISIKYRWMYQSTVGQQSATILSAVCVRVPSVEYRQCTCIGGVSVKHRHCLFNFFTDLFCRAFHTTSYQSYIRYCQQYHRTHVTKRSKLSYRYVIFGDGQTVKSTN